jgi:hypothetical protein
MVSWDRQLFIVVSHKNSLGRRWFIPAEGHGTLKFGQNASWIDLWGSTMQSSFSELEYGAKKKATRRDRFLAEIEAVTPWTDLAAVLEPFYPKGEGRGRATP